jgi:hypothetical protein
MWRLRRQANCTLRSLTLLRSVRMLAMCTQSRFLVVLMTFFVLLISSSALNFVLEFSTDAGFHVAFRS